MSYPSSFCTLNPLVIGMATKLENAEAKQHGQEEKDQIIYSGINKQQRGEKKKKNEKNCFIACLSSQNTPLHNSLSYFYEFLILFPSPCVFCSLCHFLYDLFSPLHTYSKLLFLNQIWHTFLKSFLFFPMLCFSALNSPLLHIFPPSSKPKALLCN